MTLTLMPQPSDQGGPKWPLLARNSSVFPKTNRINNTRSLRTQRAHTQLRDALADIMTMVGDASIITKIRSSKKCVLNLFLQKKNQKEEAKTRTKAKA